jgi:hypothetical protein
MTQQQHPQQTQLGTATVLAEETQKIEAMLAAQDAELDQLREMAIPRGARGQAPSLEQITAALDEIMEAPPVGHVAPPIAVSMFTRFA